tara:strand:+ start:375 stop:533 length:159 start_codon:yes stop_codon:yes gene_type:complete
MIKKFKKESGYIVIYDSKVHSLNYLENLKSKFEEVKDKPKIKKESSKKKGDK